jgi:hypothetical protein
MRFLSKRSVMRTYPILHGHLLYCTYFLVVDDVMVDDHWWVVAEKFHLYRAIGDSGLFQKTVEVLRLIGILKRKQGKNTRLKSSIPKFPKIEIRVVLENIFD